MRSRRSRSALETYLGRLCDTTAERFGLNDRRSVIIRLTDRGAALIDEAIAAQVAEEKRVMSALKPDEQRRLNGLMRKLMLVFGDPS